MVSGKHKVLACWIGLSSFALAALGAAEAAGGSPPGAALGDGEEGLRFLAQIVGEKPGSAASIGLGDGASCGEEGHCSAASCGCSDCPAGSYPICACSESGTCDDKHNPWNPFDNDTHVAYSTSCTCTTTPPPPPPPDPPCTVYNPLNGQCLVDAFDMSTT